MAFDRIEHNSLFQALSQHGLDPSYCSLLRSIYNGQFGALSEEINFPITRGVRQGDILSPTLFNAALEHAVAKWKTCLSQYDGFALVDDANQERLTNIRFADDLLIFGKTLHEAVSMVEKLVHILAEYGLEMNVKKTKLLSTTTISNETVLVDTSVGFLELVSAGSFHKYLGRSWPGNLCNRGEAAVSHRIGCAWAKFRNQEATLMNKSISLALRLKLFNTTVTPALLYSLDTCPLTDRLLRKLDVIQRKMLRKIIGWVFGDPEDTWEEIGRRMKMRMTAGLQSYPIQDWSAMSSSRKKALQERTCSPTTSHLVQQAVNWKPYLCELLNSQIAYRSVGRPPYRWNDDI